MAAAISRAYFMAATCFIGDVPSVVLLPLWEKVPDRADEG